MLNNFNLSLAISVVVHLGLFLLFSSSVNNVMYVNVPVDLMFYQPKQAAAPVVHSEPVKKKKKKKKKEETIPQKVIKKKSAARKETIVEKKKEEPKPVEPTKDVAASSSPSADMRGSATQLSLDAARFPYSYYTNVIIKRINRNWEWATAFGQLKAVVFFSVDRAGEISQTRIEESSGDDVFDQQALRAVTLASPLPPLPEGYGEDSLGVYFEFLFRE